MKRKLKDKKTKKNIIIAMLASLSLICVIAICIKYIPNKEEQNVQVKNPSEKYDKLEDKEQNKDSDKLEDKDNKEENNKAEADESGNNTKTEGNTTTEEVVLDNSGYLSLEDDPNAEDVAIVSENTKALLKGTKTYPVRTDGKKVVYLTFDDGPSTTNTPQILDILDQYNVKATFFILGKSLEDDTAKELLKEQVKRGHAIGNHTYGHDYKYLYPNRVINVDNVMADLNKNENLMKEILGKDFTTRVMRFPGGYWSWEGRQPMKDRMEIEDIYNVDWNTLNKDAEGKKKNSNELVQCTKDGVQLLGPEADSVVLLMHDTYGKEETVKALPSIIEYFQNNGFEFKTMK